jgi:hypothetical protein
MPAKVADEFTSRMFEAINNMLLDMLAAVARKDYDDGRRRQAQGQAKAKAAGLYEGRAEDVERNAGIASMIAAGASWSAIQLATAAAGQQSPRSRSGRSRPPGRAARRPARPFAVLHLGNDAVNASLPSMTQFFFDLRSVDSISQDEEGIELPDAAAAHRMALGALSDAARDAVIEGSTDLDGDSAIPQTSKHIVVIAASLGTRAGSARLL